MNGNSHERSAEASFIVGAREEAKRRDQERKLPHGHLSVFALGAVWGAEQAWSEGHQAGWEERHDDAIGGWMPSGYEQDTGNPYRKDETNE